jgi:hypothetical protein
MESLVSLIVLTLRTIVESLAKREVVALPLVFPFVVRILLSELLLWQMEGKVKFTHLPPPATLRTWMNFFGKMKLHKRLYTLRWKEFIVQREETEQIRERSRRKRRGVVRVKCALVATRVFSLKMKREEC